MNYLLIGAAVAIFILSGIVGIQYKVIEGLNQDVATERANVSTLKTTIEDQNKTILTIESQRAADQVKLDWVAERNRQAIKKKNDAEAKINSYRKRLDKVAIAKPELVSRLATKATARMMNDFLLATEVKPGSVAGVAKETPQHEKTSRQTTPVQ